MNHKGKPNSVDMVDDFVYSWTGNHIDGLDTCSHCEFYDQLSAIVEQIIGEDEPVPRVYSDKMDSHLEQNAIRRNALRNVQRIRAKQLGLLKERE